MNTKVHLLVIDPQRDFCEAPGNGGGALFVNGATEDMQRLTHFVERVGSKLDDIHVTLDSHHLVHVANPIFWKNSHGDNPSPFTIITRKDVEDGKWMAAQPSFQRWCVEYTTSLEKNNRYPLCIWPPHCLISSSGHAVVPELFNSLKKWEEEFAVVNYVTKGSNIRTEHYSAIKADVPDPKDPSTQINTSLVDVLMSADLIAVAGEAGSHCLANTVRDIAEAFGDDKYIQKLVLLQDATSPVPGFEKMQEDFIKEMTSRGMQISTTDKFLK
jgi:nicotinamidase-related amidase